MSHKLKDIADTLGYNVYLLPTIFIRALPIFSQRKAMSGFGRSSVVSVRSVTGVIHLKRALRTLVFQASAGSEIAFGLDYVCCLRVFGMVEVHLVSVRGCYPAILGYLSDGVLKTLGPNLYELIRYFLQRSDCCAHVSLGERVRRNGAVMDLCRGSSGDHIDVECQGRRGWLCGSL